MEVKTMKILRKKVIQVIDIPELGSQIKTAREKYCIEHGLSIPHFSVNLLDITPQMLYRIEDENQAVDEELLRKLEQVLGHDFGVSFE